MSFGTTRANGRDGTAPSLVGEDFRFRWSGSSVADLFDSISQTMPLAAPNSLSSRDYADLTAYVLELNGYPDGSAEIDPGARGDLLRTMIEQ